MSGGTRKHQYCWCDEVKADHCTCEHSLNKWGMQYTVRPADPSDTYCI